jgi:thioredoxin:protein disulfide reductase
MRAILLRACALLTVAAAPAALALDANEALRKLLGAAPEFLPVDQAFRLSVETGTDGAVLARWEVAEGYYLYRHAFGAAVRRPGTDEPAPVVLGEPEIPPGLHKVDDYFGEVEVYYRAAQMRVPVAAGGGAVEVGISYQGCADAGLCYPPETRWFPLVLTTAGAGPVLDAPSAPAVAPVPPTEEQMLAAALAGRGLAVALALFFVGGIGLAFTPCVLPMVPILSSIIVGHQGTLSRGRALALSSSYVLGMATTYAVVGVLVGLFGASLNLQAALQAPPVLVAFAAVFVALALAMFGFYELRLPQRWQDGLNTLGNRVGGGRHFSVVAMGALSALVVTPCVSAPLAGALIYLSTTGDAVLGGSALLALGLGMGVPLLVIGASGGHLLPRAGAWMNAVKAAFGVGLLAVAVWLLERIVPASLTLVLWAGLAISVGVYLGALDFSPRSGWPQFWKAGGAFSFIYGVLLLIGAASGADDPLKPLARFAAGPASGAPAAAVELAWRPVRTVADVEREVAAARAEGRPALLDLYADWCISCKVMERSVFPRPDVASKLREFRLLRADVTRNDADDRALLEAYGLFGPPSLVFFGPDGREMRDVRVQGEIGAAALAGHLGAVLARVGARGAGEIASNY